VPWNHEEGFHEGRPIEGTIARPKRAPGPARSCASSVAHALPRTAPPSSTLFDTSPADALRATWQPPDLSALYADRPSTSALAARLPELPPSYAEFGNRTAQARRRRLANVRVRYNLRRRLRAKRHGRIREAAEMPKRGGWYGRDFARAPRPPAKWRARLVAEGKDPAALYGRATGRTKYEARAGLAWPK
jgi:hypothetical protein